MAKLQRNVANLSSVLKGKLCESWMEEGDGKDSTWGQIRLEVLRERGVGFGGVTNFPVASSADSSQLAATLLSRARVFDDVQINQNLGNGGLPRGDVIDKSANQFNEECGGGEEDADGEASSEGEVEEQELVGHTMERESSSSSNTKVPVIINTYGYGAVRPSEEKSSIEPCKDKENLTPANQSVSVAFACLRCARTYHSKKSLIEHSKTHWSKYTCKICKRSYTSEHSFKRHLKKKTCLRPFLSGPKTSCRYCGHGFYDITTHEKCCKKNRPKVPKTPCRYCDIQFVDIKRHERVCKKNSCNQPDDSWKQHLQLEKISDVEKESDNDSQQLITDNQHNAY
ncbi:unnamed protein product [Orchesella dallaii]|uniref:C2H2-type domain-containing protein n=1 Tax=Orchesella dallaii TaxID=48710 RepID=A0ABP1RZG5_9HEXA